MPKIEYLPPQQLKPWPGNSRKHSRKQIRQLASSIRRFGFTSPVIIDEETRILAGHGRVRAACELGLTQVPCHRLDHLSETEKRAYVIADNKLALNSSWDRKRLAQEISDFRTQEIEFDVGVIGFTVAEMNGLFDLKSDGQDRSPPETRCEPGDVWQIGPHRLVCGERLSGPVFEGHKPNCIEEMIVVRTQDRTPTGSTSNRNDRWNADALLAADRAGRFVILAEPDPGQCDLILARWDSHSDHSPIKLEVSR